MMMNDDDDDLIIKLNPKKKRSSAYVISAYIIPSRGSGGFSPEPCALLTLLR